MMYNVSFEDVEPLLAVFANNPVDAVKMAQNQLEDLLGCDVNKEGARVWEADKYGNGKPVYEEPYKE